MTEKKFPFATSVLPNRQFRPFVVAFNRDRDFYQVPLALQEGNLLAGLVTDLYAPSMGPLTHIWPFNRFARRRVSNLPFHKVSWNWTALRLQLYNLPQARSGGERIAIFKQLDRALSHAALGLALRRQADLFLYSGYAYEAFTDPAARELRKGLFVFHPHGRSSLKILAADIEKHPEVAESHSWHKTEIALSDGSRLDAETGAADFLTCASSFTAESLRDIRSASQKVTIAPYGCFLPQAPISSRRQKGSVRFLFVGQGVQRKGLHHLLKTWRRLGLTDATLSIVSSSMDPGILTLTNQPNVILLGPQSPGSLQQLYNEADIFIMPSLIEGFGLVYLEALSAGCFIIGTHNTGLPDLNLPEDVGNVIPSGDLNALEEAIEAARSLVNAGLLDRHRIQAFAHERSWVSFRRAIYGACQL